MEAVVLHRVGFLAYFCPKQGQDFKASAAPLCPNLVKNPPWGQPAGSKAKRNMSLRYTCVKKLQNGGLSKENRCVHVSQVN